VSAQAFLNGEEIDLADLRIVVDESFNPQEVYYRGELVPAGDLTLRGTFVNTYSHDSGPWIKTMVAHHYPSWIFDPRPPEDEVAE
jgi:hypothetical protein